jgi:hypothetical protein
MKHWPLVFSTFAVVTALQSASCKVYVDAGGDGGGGAGSGSTGGGAIVPSTPEIVVSGRAGTLAVDDTFLYIGDTQPVPFRVPKAGGAAQSVVPVGTFDPAGNVTVLALDETNIYWVDYIGAQPLFQVWSAPKDGSSLATLLSTLVGPNNAQPFGIAVDSEYVYLTLPDIYNSNAAPDQLNGAVHRVLKTGGTTESIATVFSRTIAADDTYVYWPHVASDNSGELIRASKDGSNQTVIATEVGPIISVFARDGRVFWTYQDSFLAYNLRSSNNGAAPTTLATSKDPFGPPVAGSDAVYWLVPGVAGTAGAVIKAAFDGTVTTVVDATTSQVSPIYYGAYGPRIAVDDQSVYFSYEPQTPAEGASRVYRAAR